MSRCERGSAQVRDLGAACGAARGAGASVVAWQGAARGAAFSSVCRRLKVQN